MFHYMTRAEYLDRINDLMLDQLRKVSSSKEAAKELIDSLGIRHLLIPMTEEEIRAKDEAEAEEEKRTAK